ncbi:3'-5' exonuclease [Candidatus Pacearchaeota archaeon]|nr:3'-5' exonuclease [Candidatus Pacearchaeota archaeon]
MIPNYLKGYVLVFDTETAYLGDHVCEVGFSIFKDTNLVHEWNTLVKPLVPIDPEATKVHKINDSDVEDAPTFAEIVGWVTGNLTAADVHVAYNYEYDRGVFENEFKRLGMKFPIKPMIDPFILFKQWHKYNKGKTLIKAAEKYGIQYVGAHRASSDATVTGKVLFKMAAIKTTFPKTIKSFLTKQRKWVEEQYIDLNNYFKSQGKGEIDKPVYEYFEV